MIRKKCPAVAWVWGKSFKVDVSVEILHIIQMTLNYCIGFSESEHLSENKSSMLDVGS